MMSDKVAISFSRRLKLGRIFCCGLFLSSLVLIISPAARADTALKFEKSTVYGDTLDQTGNAIELSEGQLYVAGSESTADLKALALSYNVPPAGNPLFSFRWQSKIDPSSSEIFTDVALTADGLYFTGQSWSTKTKQSWPFLTKFSNQGKSQSGVHVWFARPQLFEKYQEGIFHAVLPVEEETGTAIYATGYASSQQANRTAILAKYDSSGNLLWSQKLSDEGEQNRGEGLSLAVQNGSIYVGGYTGKGEKKVDFDSIPVYTALWKYDPSGKQIWMKKEANSQLHLMKNEMKSVKVSLAASEGFLYLAVAKKKGGEADVFLLKYDSNGAQLWTSAWDGKSATGGARTGIPTGLAADKNRLYVAGWTESPGKKTLNPNEDAFLLEVDTEYGFVLAVHDYGELEQQERALGVQASETDVYLAGSQRAPASKGEITQNDLVLLQYKFQPITNVKIEIQMETERPAKIEEGEEDTGASKIAVTILSNNDFNPNKAVKTKSLTFGRSGYEPSWDSCGMKDVNSDGIQDLVCYFEPRFKFQKIQQDIFLAGDTEGILRGDTILGVPFVGKAKLRADKPDSNTTKEAAPAPIPEPLPLPILSSEPTPLEPQSGAPVAPEPAPEAPVAEPLPIVEEAPIQPPQVEIPAIVTPEAPITAPLPMVTAPIIEPSTSAEVSIQYLEPETSTTTTSQELVSAPSTSTEVSIQNPEPTASTITTLQAPAAASLPLMTVSTVQPITTPTATTTSSTTTATTKTTTSVQPTLVIIPQRTTTVSQPVPSTTIPKEAVPAVRTTSTEKISTLVDKLRTLRSIEAQNEAQESQVKESLQSREDPLPSTTPESGIIQAYNDMGHEAFKSGKMEEAIVQFKEALKLDPKSVEAHTYVGLALVKAGKLEEARDHITEAAKLKPGDEDIQELLKTVLDQIEEQKTKR